MSAILKELRLKHGYTQNEMAKLLGYKDKSGYCHLENGDVKLSLEKASIVSKLFNVDPSIFFNIKVDKT